ncbi:MAG: aspartyl-tRNA amidotransferase subunit B [Patescibacteria group bacterium]|nr:MAG: aspartyl-tRNA amidotransferase subunit B [Patescibacteria group bacterium]
MLKQKIQEDQIQALKSGDKDRLDVLRFILSQIKNKEIDKNQPSGGELTDEEVILVLKKIAKELKESIEAFKKGGREDLVKENEKQLAVVNQYLPKELSDWQLQQAIEKIIADNKDIFEKNPKAIIGICMKSLRAQADSSRIMKILSTYVKN